MKALNWRWLVVAGVIACGGLAQAQVPVPALPAKPPFANPKDAIPARQHGFDGNNDIGKAMKKAIDSGQDVSGFVPDAQWMAAWSKQIPGMFPPGSETGPGIEHDTKALPAIWSDKAEFDKDAAAFGQAAEKMATLAQANDKAGFQKQFEVLGGTCGACHRSFRAK